VCEAQASSERVIGMTVSREALRDLQALGRAWAEGHVAAGATVEEIEAAALEAGQALALGVAEQGLVASARSSYEGCSRPCGCGRKAKFVGYRPRMLVTVVGEVRVRRPYYHCRHCGTSRRPWDEAAGLSDRCYTPGVKAMVSQAAARMSYQDAVAFLAELTPVRLEESAAQWIVAEVGGRVRQAQAEEAAHYLGGRAVRPDGPPVERLYVTMDGSCAHIDGEWHEVKTGVVYRARPGPEGLDQSGEKRYLSLQATAETFAERLYVTALQAGVHRAEEVVVIGDGAAWIWRYADHHYPGATEIVDYWHACQHLHDLAQLQYGEGSPQGQRWARDQGRRLLASGPRPLLCALRRMKATSPEAAERLRTTRNYFRHNAHRMRYPEFRARGLMIGSGVAEAACKVAVEQRLKGAGMRWKHDGADHILALRCLVLNRQTDQIRHFAKAA
jgi:Uncharacterised protein family (UPF0236)